MTESARIEITLPAIKPENLAKLRRSRPLASLGTGWAKEKPTAHVSEPLEKPDYWSCWVPGPIDGRSHIAFAKYAFDAKQEAALALHCEPGEVRLWGRA